MITHSKRSPVLNMYGDPFVIPRKADRMDVPASHPVSHDAILEAFESLRNDYELGRDTRLRKTRTRIKPLGASGDYNIRQQADFLKAIEVARDIERNDMVVGQGLRRFAANVLPEPLKVDPETGDDDIDAELRDRWEQTIGDAADPLLVDIRGEDTFDAIVRRSLIRSVVDGDIFHAIVGDDQIQSIEGHLVQSPRSFNSKAIVNGVELTATRRRRAIFVKGDSLDPFGGVDINRFTRRTTRHRSGRVQVMHFYDNNRFTQSRGFSALNGCFDACDKHNDIQFSKMLQAKLTSFFAFLRNRPLEDESEEATPIGELTDNGEYIPYPGSELVSDPGERIEGFSARVPNPEFFPHAKILLTIIALNMDLPLAVFLMDGSETNFNGWRGMLEQARFRFRQIQRGLGCRIVTPYYKWKVARFARESRRLSRASVDIFRHRIHLPVYPYVQPLQDATADLVRLRNGLISKRQYHAERNRDDKIVAKEINDGRAHDLELAIATADDLNQRYPGANVSWRDVLPQPSPDGVNVSINPDTGALDNAPNQDDQ